MSRILTNYARMAINFALGLLLVRVLLTMGEGVYAVVVLLGTSVGISGMLREVVRAAMVAEVGLALHSNEPERFEKTYSTAFVLSLIAALLAVGILGTFYVFLDKFNIPDELVSAAGTFLICRALYTFVAIGAAPTMNLLPITGRMGEMNIWLTLERLAEVGAAYLILIVFSGAQAADQLQYFAYLSTGLMIVVTVGWVLSPIIRDRRFLPRLGNFDYQILKKIRATIGWNGFVVAAMNLYGPFMTIVINLAFGVGATVVFGIAYQLLSYIRQAVMGVVFGLDAVFTRLSGAGGNHAGRLIAQVTKLQTAVIVGLSGWCAINIELLLNIWVGKRLDNPVEQIATAALFFQILIFGFIARSITEGWMKYLSGVGKVASYGPLLLKGAIINPIAIGLAILLLPQGMALIASLVSFSVLLSVVHLGFLPRVLSRATGFSVTEILSPILPPLFLLLIASAGSYLAIALMAPQPFAQIGITSSLFAIVFGPPFIIWLRALNEKSLEQE